MCFQAELTAHCVFKGTTRSTVQMTKCFWIASVKSLLESKIIAMGISWRTLFCRKGSHRVRWTTWRNISPVPKSRSRLDLILKPIKKLWWLTLASDILSAYTDVFFWNLSLVWMQMCGRSSSPDQLYPSSSDCSVVWRHSTPPPRYKRIIPL